MKEVMTVKGKPVFVPFKKELMFLPLN